MCCRTCPPGLGSSILGWFPAEWQELMDLWVAGTSSFIPDAVLHFNAMATKHLQSRLSQSGHRHVHLIALFFRSVEPAREPRPMSRLRAVAARMSFLGQASFEEFEFFSGYAAWNSLASSSYWLLFVEPANYFDGRFLPTMYIFTFFYHPINMWSFFLIVCWKRDLRSCSCFLKRSLYLSHYFVSLFLFSAVTPISTFLNQLCLDSVVTGSYIWNG